MKSLKKTVITAVVTTIITSSVVFAMSSQPWAASGRSGMKVYVVATFTDQEVTAGNAYGAKEGKIVKASTVRLREGDYDQSQTNNKAGVANRLEKVNNPLQTAYGTWNWSYK